MKKIHSILSVLLGVVAVATVLSAFGVSVDGSIVDAIVNFFSLGSMGGVVAMAAIVGPGSAEVTESVASGSSQGPIDGTTVVSKIPDSTAEPGIGTVEAAYLDEDLDKQIVKIRPQDTPIDTFTRSIANIVKSESWEAGGWEIGTRETRDKLGAAASAGATSLTVENGDMWKPGDTILFHTIDANGNDTGVKMNGNVPVSAIVNAVSGNTLTVRGINYLSANGTIGASAALPALADDTIIERLSPAVSELEASVEGFVMQPGSRKYYNQVHMTQVEESVIHALLKKKVAMDFSVYKEQTLWDFKRGMELSNLFGVGGLTKNAKGELVHLATGLWWQMDRQKDIGYSSSLSDQTWNGIGKYIFEDNNGADRRLFFAGNDLLMQIANVSSYAKQLEAKNTEMVLGLRVFKIETPFGELLVKPMGSLFKGYFSKCGMIIDPNYVKKYVMEPLQTTKLNLNETGQRRVDNAVRIHETYSLFLENLPCHTRIVPSA